VGDIAAPSVGPGNVTDLIASGRVPVVHFTKSSVKLKQRNCQQCPQDKQKESTRTRINFSDSSHGLLVVGRSNPGTEYKLFENWLTVNLNGASTRRLTSRPVPADTRRNGTRNLNTVLQQMINLGPAKTGNRSGRSNSARGRPGDQKKNDYDRRCGDMGAITIDLEEPEVTVEFAERQVSYDCADLELHSLMSVTVHKSSGVRISSDFTSLHTRAIDALAESALYRDASY